MSVMKRLSGIVQAKANKALDKAENPADMLDLSYEKQQENLTKVRRALADVATARKRLELQASQLQGQAQKLQVIVVNTGSAPIQNLSLSATGLPSGWTMTFAPDKLDSIDPGTNRQVEATLTPGAKAIAGDYSISLSASSTQASVNKDFRVTVETPTIWGWVGIGIVVVVVGGLVWMFASYSRR